jgi:GNT-I family
MAGGGDMRIILTGNNRPQYMRATIESWSRVRGIQDVMVEFHLEPGNPAVEVACSEAPFPREVYVAGGHQGVQRNPWQAACHAFEASDFVVLAEDDMIVGTDTLEYLSWAERYFRADKNVLAVTAANIEPGDPPVPGAVSLEHRFQGWVWGIWRDRWDIIGPDWTFAYEHNGWDYRLSEHWCRDVGMMTVFPHLSRVQHIGREGGTHCTPEMFVGLLSQSFLPEAEPQEYYVAEELWISSSTWAAGRCLRRGS